MVPFWYMSTLGFSFLHVKQNKENRDNSMLWNTMNLGSSWHLTSEGKLCKKVNENWLFYFSMTCMPSSLVANDSTLLGFLNGVLYLGCLHHPHRHHSQLPVRPNLGRVPRECFLRHCHSPGLPLHSHPHISWLWQSSSFRVFPRLSPLWILAARKHKTSQIKT
jgi:hypothetical protein